MRIPWLTFFALLSCSPQVDPVSRPEEPSQARLSEPAPIPAKPTKAQATDAPQKLAAPRPEPPRAPAYDLEADLKARVAEAHSDLGRRTATEVVHDVFLLASPAGKGALANPENITRRTITALLNDRFAKKPERVISVYLFAEATSFNKYCQREYGEACSSPYGFYLRSQRRIVMNVGLGIGTLTHELVHPMMEADFPQAPEWLNEGIASLYEQFALPRPGEIRGYKNWRHPRLLQALRSPQERDRARPSALMVMSDAEFRGTLEDLNYATARYLCQWLDSRNELWPFYQRYRDSYAADPTGQAAFRATTGLEPQEADAIFVRWARGL